MELLWLLAGGFLCLLVRLLNTFSSSEKPILYYKDGNSEFIKSVLEMCPIFTSVYNPTSMWGKSGHLQTLVHVKMGRTKPRWPDSERFHLVMPDGATMSYDLFEPHNDGEKAKFTLALCPGIANTSECIYMRSFAALAQSHGYRVAILNHLGALKSEVLTAPRIFTYGGTEEYDRMVNHLLEKFPDTKILAVGFSMGGNIVTKYLGESEKHQQKVLCGVSVCQGYDVNESKELFLKWQNMIRIYNFMMTMKQRFLLARHRQLLFSEEARTIYQQMFDEMAVFKATALHHIDENYSSLRAGFKNADEYYKYSSSSNYIHNIKVPMFFLNSLDDPVCPEELLKHPRNFVESTPNCIFITTKHGGHLGYFEGGLIVPDTITWLDRAIIEYTNALTILYLDGKLPGHTDVTQKMMITNPTEPLQTKGENYVTKGEKSENKGENYMTLPQTGYGDSIEVDLRKRNISDQSGGDMEEQKRGSLKRGALLQATSFVQ